MCDRFDRRGGERGKSADPKYGGTSLAVGWSMEARRGASSAAGPVQACGWPVLGWSGCGPPVPPRSVAGEAVSSEKAVYAVRACCVPRILGKGVVHSFGLFTPRDRSSISIIDAARGVEAASCAGAVRPVGRALPA